ncbi:hypothetical protein OH77DRAFT_121405 [Trametes cingulata]|nr:hypothetical protein OH77DRAFT_121405 [Trametes cingulata]
MYKPAVIEMKHSEQARQRSRTRDARRGAYVEVDVLTTYLTDAAARRKSRNFRSRKSATRSAPSSTLRVSSNILSPLYLWAKWTKERTKEGSRTAGLWRAEERTRRRGRDLRWTYNPPRARGRWTWHHWEELPARSAREPGFSAGGVPERRAFPLSCSHVRGHQLCLGPPR